MKVLAVTIALVFGFVSSGAADDVSDAMLIQKSLTMLGHDVGPIDGKMTRNTKAALIRYQIDSGLRPTGQMNSDTWGQLLIDVARALGSGKRVPYSTSENDDGLSTLQPLGPPALVGEDGEYLGNLSTNKYSPNSTGNPYGRYGSPYSPESITNPYSRYGSAYSPDGARNPYTSGGPRLYARDGSYLGRLNANRYDPESVNNPYGVYGSRYSPMSIRNPYGLYGSPYSPLSPNNPYGFGLDDE